MSPFLTHVGKCVFAVRNGSEAAGEAGRSEGFLRKARVGRVTFDY